MLKADAKHNTFAPDTAFAAIEIICKDADHSAYQGLPASDKIKLLEQIIEYTCKQFQEKEKKGEIQPNSMWIVSWREYGVTESNYTFVTKQTRDLLKTTMQKLTKSYSQLHIVTGSLAVHRTVDKKSDENLVNRIEKSYINIKKLQDKEDQNPDSMHQIITHAKSIKMVKYNNQITLFDVIRNTSFIFPENKKHCKITPFKESLGCNKALTPYIVYYPGKIANCLFSFAHPIRKEPFTGVLETCREHFLGVSSLASDRKNELQLVSSDSIRLYAGNIRGKNVIHIDSERSATFFSEEDSNHPSIAFYRINLLDSMRNNPLLLEGPIKPIDILEKMIKDNLEGVDINEEFIKNNIKKLNNEYGSYKYSILHVAFHFKTDREIELLIKHGADVNKRTITKSTPLHCAITTRNAKKTSIQLLLEAKANINAQNVDGDTPLHLAYNNHILLQVLLDKKYQANIDTLNSKNYTAAHYAARKANLASLELLLTAGADLTKLNNQNKSPLGYLEEHFKKFFYNLEKLCSKLSFYPNLCMYICKTSGYENLKSILAKMPIYVKVDTQLETAIKKLHKSKTIAPSILVSNLFLLQASTTPLVTKDGKGESCKSKLYLAKK